MVRKVAIFLNQHLPLSEVFIAHQARELKRYLPSFIACRQVKASVVHSIPTYILNKNFSMIERVREALFKITGYSEFILDKIKGYDVIHAHFGPTGWLLTNIAQQANIPLVVTLHGFDVLKNNITLRNDGLIQYLYKLFLKRLTHQASLFICNSEYLKERAVEFGFPKEKCVVSYLGMSLNLHDQKKYIRTDKMEPFRVLSVGRLVPMKGHSHLIEAISGLEKEGYNIRLDIIGAGPLQGELQQQASSTIKNFKFWGGQPHDKILSLMRQSDILCHLSHQTENGYNEAFGLAVIEAQWSGLPVVAYRSGGVPEGIDDGKTGILCPENDIQSVQRAISQLIDNDILRQEMSNAAPEFVRQNFDGEKLTAQLENLYDEVCNNYKKVA